MKHSKTWSHTTRLNWPKQKPKVWCYKKMVLQLALGCKKLFKVFVLLVLQLFYYTLMGIQSEYQSVVMPNFGRSIMGLWQLWSPMKCTKNSRGLLPQCLYSFFVLLMKQQTTQNMVCYCYCPTRRARLVHVMISEEVNQMQSHA